MKRATIIAALGLGLLATMTSPGRAAIEFPTKLAQAAPAPSTVTLPAIVTATPAGTTEARLVVSGGSIIGDVLQWLALVFGTPLGLLAAAWLKRAFTAAGLQATDAMLAKFQEQVANGVNLAAHEAGVSLKDKLSIEVKGDIAARVVEYVQEHGAENAKALGFDPNDPKFIEAVQARASRVMTELAPPVTPVVNVTSPAAV